MVVFTDASYQMRRSRGELGVEAAHTRAAEHALEVDRARRAAVVAHGDGAAAHNGAARRERVLRARARFVLIKYYN